MEQSPLPFRKRSLQGGISVLYGSNGRRYVATGQLEGAFPGDFAWRLQGTWSNSGDRSTAHYLLNNTGTREYHASASLGYDRGRLRVEGFYSRFYSRTGVMLSARWVARTCWRNVSGLVAPCTRILSPVVSGLPARRSLIRSHSAGCGSA